MSFLDALKILGPAILAVVPGAQPFIPILVAGMTIAEESRKPGAKKKEIFLESVSLGAAAANTIAKKEVLNPVEAVEVANQSVDTVIAVTKLVQKMTDKTEE